MSAEQQQGGRRLVRAPWPGRHALLLGMRVPALGGIALVGVAAIAPAAPLWPIPAFMLAFSAVAGLALGTALACPPLPPKSLALLALPVALLLGAELAGGVEAPEVALVLMALLVAGTVLGSVVGTAIEHPGHLLFVAIVSAAADALSVLHPGGTSAAILESERALALLALSFPMLGTSDIPPLLGVGDVVFTALYVAAARRHAFFATRTWVVLAFAFVATMSAVIVLQIALPALPFLGVAMLLAHPEARRPPEAERVTGYVVGALVLAALAAFFAF